MSTAGIIAICVLVALGFYVAWLAGKPETVALVPEDCAKALREHFPADTVEGNSLSTFTDFDSLVSAIEADVAGAKSYVHLLFFKYEDDPVGRRLGNLLSRKAAEGVEVRLMYDDAVNKSRYPLYRDLRAAGLDVRGFGKMVIPFLRKKDNYRNHRKIVVVDGRVAYVGGMNIAERYGLGLGWGRWRDTQLRIEGPAAAACELAFATDWVHEDPSAAAVLSDARYYPEVPASGTSKVEILCSGPIGEGPVIMDRICRMLDESREYVWMESPYLIPTPQVRDSIIRAARRGVDVRLIIPPRGDRGVLTPLATKAYVGPMLREGVRIWLYDPGYMHSKTIVCDGRYATVGSTNIDSRSFLLDLEVNAFIDDPVYEASLKEIFLDDAARSSEIDPAAWARRPLPEKAAESFAKLFSYQL